MADELPFLVLGAGRGGTSLLAACLSGHSRLAVGMELFGWSHLMGGSLPAGRLDRLFDERVAAFREACAAERAAHAGRLWGNKLTTEQIFGLEDHNALNLPYGDLIARFFAEAVPEYRIVFIIRDGRACVESKVRRTGQTWEHAAFRWHYAVRVLAAVRRLDRPTCVIRFEDLITAPEQTLRAAADCLGVPFEDAMLRQTESTALLPDYRRPDFDAGRRGVPWVPPHIAAFLQPDLEACGYR